MTRLFEFKGGTDIDNLLVLVLAIASSFIKRRKPSCVWYDR